MSVLGRLESRAVVGHRKMHRLSDRGNSSVTSIVRAPGMLHRIGHRFLAMRSRLYSTSGGQTRRFLVQLQLQADVLGFGDLARGLLRSTPRPDPSAAAAQSRHAMRRGFPQASCRRPE